MKNAKTEQMVKAVMESLDEVKQEELREYDNRNTLSFRENECRGNEENSHWNYKSALIYSLFEELLNEYKEVGENRNWLYSKFPEELKCYNDKLFEEIEIYRNRIKELLKEDASHTQPMTCTCRRVLTKEECETFNDSYEEYMKSNCEKNNDLTCKDKFHNTHEFGKRK